MTEDLKYRADELLRNAGIVVSDHQGICSTSPTGEHYVVLESSGPRDIGIRRLPANACPSRQDAVDSYLNALQALADAKSGTAYWRRHPEVEPFYHGWTVYSRILISDKPEIANVDQAA